MLNFFSLEIALRKEQTIVEDLKCSIVIKDQELKTKLENLQSECVLWEGTCSQQKGMSHEIKNKLIEAKSTVIFNNVILAPKGQTQEIKNFNSSSVKDNMNRIVIRLRVELH